MTRRRALAGDAALGALAATGLPPLDFWALTPLALALLLPRLAAAPTPRAAALRAGAAGLGWFAFALFWIVEPFLVDPARHGWMAPFALVLMAAGGALFWALPVALARTLPRPLPAIAAALLLSDWLRGWLFTGFPWARIGHALAETPLAQAAALAGDLGLTALVLLAALAAARARGVGLAAALAATAGLWTWGAARQAAPPPDTAAIIRIVQPNADQRLKWDPDWARVFYDRLLALSAAQGRRDLVLWPETAVNFLLNDAGPVLPAIAEAAGAPLLAGIQRTEGLRFFNSLALIERGGGVTALYDKAHLVPFGEYMPWGDALARVGIAAFAAQAGRGYTPGPGPDILPLPGALPAVQPLICYEAIFPQALRGLPARPGLLVQATNDAWFGTLSGPHQHLSLARLRAIETGLPLARAANTGISALIDARGTVRAALPLGAEGIIDAEIPGALPETPWLRWGPAPTLALAFALLAAAAIPRRRARALV